MDNVKAEIELTLKMALGYVIQNNSKPLDGIMVSANIEALSMLELRLERAIDLLDKQV